MNFKKVFLTFFLIYGGLSNGFITSGIISRQGQKNINRLSLYSKKNNTDIFGRIFKTKKDDRYYGLYEKRQFGLSEYDFYLSQITIYMIMCYYLYMYIALGIAQLYGL